MTPVKLIIVDDDPDDTEFFEFALDLLPGLASCKVFWDAGEALAFLTVGAERPGPHISRPEYATGGWL